MALLEHSHKYVLCLKVNHLLCNKIVFRLSYFKIITSAQDGFKYLIFTLPRSGKEEKRGVNIRHSTRNSSRIRRKVKNERVLMANGISLH